ncbi:hypothetical protein OBV_02050 [Oscillibacter valericigenes Sjm18-20]|nr:hypothetical protein OBV_02050 [Oscillibacter valericigenes Sjm18-20]
MSKQIPKRVLIVIFVITTILLLGWRLWPRSLYDIFRIEEGSISSLSVSVTEYGVKNGDAFMNQYLLSALSSDSNDFSAILSILENSQYRSDFRNLSPWDIDSVESGSGYIHYSAIITLCWSNTKIGGGDLLFLNDKKVAVGLDAKNGYLIFRPANRKTLENLAAYLMEHGEL